MDQLQQETTLKKQKRKILVIKKSLQLHFGAIVFFTVLFTTIIVGFDIYYTIQYQLFNDFKTVIDPDFKVILQSINNLLFFKLFIYAAIIFIGSFFISNKVAGPIYRFEQSCEEVGEGNLAYRVRLRKSDELLDLQDKFNLMIDNLQSKMQRIDTMAAEIETSPNIERIAELRKEINNQFHIV